MQLLQLNNYWMLLIWVFVGGYFLGRIPKKTEYLNGKIVQRWEMFAAILLASPYIIWSGFRGYIADTNMYRIGFQKAATSLLQIPEIFASDIKDPGYEVLVILLKNIIGNNPDLFFLLIAAFQMICIVVVFRKYSDDYWICLFLFVASTDYMSWMMNGMRQFISVTAIFLCYKWLLEKKYIPLIIVILVVSTIHQSALIMIPIIFIVQGKAWNAKTILMLIVTLVVIMFIDRFTPIMNDLLQNTQYDMALADTLDDGTNIIRVLVYSVPALLSLVGIKYIRVADNPIINISVNCAIVTMAIYLVSMVTSGIYIGRLPVYTTLQGYIAVPWLIKNMFTKNSARIINIMMIGLFCVFFYFQMFVIWSY